MSIMTESIRTLVRIGSSQLEMDSFILQLLSNLEEEKENGEFVIYSHLKTLTLIFTQVDITKNYDVKQIQHLLDNNSII